ncbi:hypothetical protein EJB05_30915, partial [Eragrostis curvula]
MVCGCPANISRRRSGCSKPMSAAINRSKDDATRAASAENLSTESVKDGGWAGQNLAFRDSLLGLGEDEGLAVTLHAVRQLRVHLLGFKREFEELGDVSPNVMDHLIWDPMVDELHAGRRGSISEIIRQKKGSSQRHGRIKHGKSWSNSHSCTWKKPECWQAAPRTASSSADDAGSSNLPRSTTGIPLPAMDSTAPASSVLMYRSGSCSPDPFQ